MKNSVLCVYCILLTALACCCALLPAAHAQSNDAPWSKSQNFGPYHLETGRSRRVEIHDYIKIVLPNKDVSNWNTFVTVPPTFNGQQVELCTFLIDDGPQATLMADHSPLARPVLSASVAVKPGSKLASTLTGNVTYRVTLSERHLVRGPATVPVEKLSQKDRAIFLEDTAWCDFRSDAFKKWMLNAGVSRQTGESDLSVAYRAWQYVIAHYHYYTPGSNKLSITCANDQWDCGGVSNVFCGMMRANGVPARLLVGRNALLAADSFETNLTPHVHAEFYVDGIGWIPLEFSAIQEHPEWNYEFGSDDGRFLALHLDLGVIAPVWNQDFPTAQDVRFSASGKGSFDGSRQTDTMTGALLRAGR